MHGSCYKWRHSFGSCGDATAQVLEMQEVQEGPAKVATHVLDNENFQILVLE